MFKGKLDQCKLDLPDNVTLSKDGGARGVKIQQQKTSHRQLNQLSQPGVGVEKIMRRRGNENGLCNIRFDVPLVSEGSCKYRRIPRWPVSVFASFFGRRDKAGQRPDNVPDNVWTTSWTTPDNVAREIDNKINFPSPASGSVSSRGVGGKGSNKRTLQHSVGSSTRLWRNPTKRPMSSKIVCQVFASFGCRDKAGQRPDNAPDNVWTTSWTTSDNVGQRRW